MPDAISPDQAGRAALEAFRGRHAGPAGGELHAGEAARVVRLDRTEGAYFLVPIRDAAGLRGIVQIDAQTGREETSALIKDPTSGFLLSDADARGAAQRARPQARDWAEPYLGWRPSRESFNSLRPLWVVRHGSGVVYVDQGGRVFDELSLSGRGG